MSDPRDQSLARAYELIEMDRLDEARLILEPLLAEDNDNPDVWWLYAHAVDDPVEARQALTRVQELSPDYPGAAELQRQIEAEMVQAESTPQSAATTQGDDLEFDDDFELDDDDGFQKPTERRSRLRPLLLIALLIVLIVLLLLLLNPFGNGDDSEPTQIAQTESTPTQEVMAPLDEVTPEVTEEVGATDEADDMLPGPEIEEDPDILDLEEFDEIDESDDLANGPEDTEPGAPGEIDETDPSDSLDTDPEALDEEADASSALTADFNALVAALQDDVELFSQTTEIIQSNEFGSTLIVSVCSEAGDALRDSINQVMLTAGSESERLPESVEGVGVRLINCEDGTSINTLAVSSAAAREYGDGVIDQDDYRSRWRAIG